MILITTELARKLMDHCLAVKKKNYDVPVFVVLNGDGSIVYLQHDMDLLLTDLGSSGLRVIDTRGEDPIQYHLLRQQLAEGIDFGNGVETINVYFYALAKVKVQQDEDLPTNAD